MQDLFFFLDKTTLAILSSNLGIFATTCTILATIFLSWIAYKRMRHEEKKSEAEYTNIVTNMQTNLLTPLHEHIRTLTATILHQDNELIKRSGDYKKCEQILKDTLIKIEELEEELSSIKRRKHPRNDEERILSEQKN